jgi:hypothetical protein
MENKMNKEQFYTLRQIMFLSMAGIITIIIFFHRYENICDYQGVLERWFTPLVGFVSLISFCMVLIMTLKK